MVKLRSTGGYIANFDVIHTMNSGRRIMISQTSGRLVKESERTPGEFRSLAVATSVSDTEVKESWIIMRGSNVYSTVLYTSEELAREAYPGAANLTYHLIGEAAANV
jgi:hypothetical protein